MADRVIKVVVASPSDDISERKSLLDKFQTYFTRYKYELLCNARKGWEIISSQSSYTKN